MEKKQWEKKYYNEKVIDLEKALGKENLQILKKLRISIEKGKIYTEYEFDKIYAELVKYDNDITGLYGNDSPEKINKEFEKIIKDRKHTEREKVLINMYYIECAKNIKLEKTEKNNIENTEVSEEEYNNIITKFDEIEKKCCEF